MIDIDQIRQTQAQRLLPVLKAWDDAKKRLETPLPSPTVGNRSSTRFQKTSGEKSARSIS